ncbi:hypothetical protein ACFLT2_02130 [Acidobacteriota bacterium]
MIKMKSHTVIALIAILGMISLCTMSCSSIQKGQEEDVHLQETKTFKDCTLSEVWEAALRSVADVDFIVKKRLVKSGFIYAQRREDPDSLYLPPHMNIYIRQENNEISIHCHVVIPENSKDYEVSSGYVNSFFAALYQNIR